MSKLKTLNEFDINTDSVSSKNKISSKWGTINKFNTIAFALSLGGIVALTSCESSDEKSCTDSDITINADGAFDTGPYQDPNDLGDTTDVTISADPSGAGDACADSD